MNEERLGGLELTHLDPAILAGLIEYSELKKEQLHRMGDRDHFLYAMLLAVGAVATVALKEPLHWEALYGIPFASYIIASLYVANDRRVTEIGNYLRLELAPRYAALARCNPDRVFVWEEYRLREAGRERRKGTEHRLLQAMFLLPSLAAGVTSALLANLALPWRIAILLPFLVPILPVEGWLVTQDVEEPKPLLQ